MMHIAGNAINKKLQKSLAPDLSLNAEDGIGGMEHAENDGSVAGVDSNTCKIVFGSEGIGGVNRQDF